MELNFTLNDLAEFAQEEQALFAALNEEFAPKEELSLSAPTVNVNNILAYSKALSVRKSTRLDQIELMLN